MKEELRNKIAKLLENKNQAYFDEKTFCVQNGRKFSNNRIVKIKCDPGLGHFSPWLGLKKKIYIF